MSSSSSSSSVSCSNALFDSAVLRNCIINSPCRVDFDFVVDCELPPLPPPIYDCDVPPCPPFEPPPPDFCPTISGGDNSGVNVTYVNSRCGGSSSSSAKPNIDVVVVQPSPVDCAFEIDINLDLPIPLPPCPVFTADDPNVVVVLEKDPCLTTTPQNKITVTPTENCNECEFNIELDLTIPIPQPRCPIFSTENPVTVTTARADCGTDQPSTLTVTSTPVPGDCNTPDTCEFQINLDLFIPIPIPPCPTINSNQTVSVETYYSNDSTCPPPRNSRFSVATIPIPGNCGTNEPDSCEFQFDLDLVIPIIEPPCPKFNDGSVQIAYYRDQTVTPPSQFKILPRPKTGNCSTPSQCEFDIELDLNIAIPCPQFRINNTFTGTRYVQDDFNIRNMQFVPRGTFGDECVFDVFFDIEFPMPAPYVKFNPANVTPNYAPDNCHDFKLEFPEPAAVFNPITRRWEITITPELKVPMPLVRIVGGEIKLNNGDLGSGTITVEPDPPAGIGDLCQYKITADITLNTANCSSGGGGGGGGSGSSTAGDCPGGCPSGEVCVDGACTGAYLTAPPGVLENIAAQCDSPDGPCPPDAATSCPKGSRCNPHIDFN